MLALHGVIKYATGNPIPTSEDLTVSGKTNWIARLQGIKNWHLVITEASDIIARAYYYENAKVWKRTVTWTYSGDDYVASYGEKSEAGTLTEEGIQEWIDHPSTFEYTPPKGTDGIESWVTATTKEIKSGDYGPKLVGKYLSYLVTAEASANGSSKVGIGNLVFNDGKIEANISSSANLEIVKGANGLPLGCIGPGRDTSRVTSKSQKNPQEIGYYASYSKAVSALNRWEPGAGLYFSVQGDGEVNVRYNGITRKTTCNKDYTVNDFGITTLISFIASTETIPYWKENKSSGDRYKTTWAYHEIADRRYWIEDDNGIISGSRKDGYVNDVRVHTPIHNELGVENKYPNQLENGQMTPSNITATRNGVPVFGEGDSKITDGNTDMGLLPTSLNAKERSYEIVTIGDEFDVKLQVFGTGTAYYDRISGFPRHMLKYIKYAELHCGICNTTWNVTNQVKVTGYATHNCRAYVNRVDDLLTYDVTSKVIAENEGWLTTVNYQTDEAKNNVPDSIYTLTQSKGILIVGKIYDLQIRTVNDPDWKIKAAEKLSKLPTGEQGDNSNKIVKDGIKLGYRGYFDLKTLGSSSNEIEIIPKMYYINKNTGKMEGIIGDGLEMWIKTGTNKADWDKLDPKDIIVKMQMNNTNGSVNNPLFTEEQSRMIKQNLLDLKSPYLENVEKIEYTKNLTIGGLLGLNLNTQNSVSTKCTFVYGTREHETTTTSYTSPETKSRRWLGEIYIPATARIIRTGDYNQNKQKVMNDRDIYKDGYLLLTFEVIRTQITNSLNGVEVPYLRYDEVRDCKWRKPGDAGYSAIENKSVLVKEKAGKGETVANPIKLPNGKSVTNLPADFYKTTAPMIIYDVSLRANNDIDDLATH